MNAGGWWERAAARDAKREHEGKRAAQAWIRAEAQVKALAELERTAAAADEAWERWETARLERLAAVRAAVAAGITQLAVAEQCKVTPQTVNKWLWGRRRDRS